MGDYNQIHLRYSKNQFCLSNCHGLGSNSQILFLVAFRFLLMALQLTTVSRFILLAQKYDKLNQFLRKRIVIRDRNIEKSQNI